MSVQSTRRAEAPSGAPPRTGPRLAPPPLWRSAPRRLLHDTLTLAVMLLVLTLLSTAAAAGPLYAEAVSDAAVGRALESLPANAPAKAAAVARLNGGIDPDTGQWRNMLDELAGIPGLASPRVTVQTISTELHPKVFYDPVSPVVTGPRGAAPVRLFGLDDPAASLVVASRATPAVQGVWLPDPLARSLGVSAGDPVPIRLSGTPKAPDGTTRVAGTYAVEADGRTPRQPAGRTTWTDLGNEAFPYDSEETTKRAHLAVSDLATTAAVADAIDDELLWSAQSRLAGQHPRLAEFHTTADAVSLLRRLLVSRSQLADEPASLRPSLVSGIEDLAQRADVLSSAAQRGAAVTTRVGIALCLALVVAAAGYSMGRRRHEVRLAAGLGRRPASAGLLYAAELVPAAVVAGVAGWLVARLLVALVVGAAEPTRTVLVSSGTWCAAVLLVALLASAAVAAVATRIETRRLEGRPDLRPPWLAVLVACAAAAAAGLLTRPPTPGEGLGPLDVLAPPLLVAAVAAVGARLFFALLRRVGTSRRHPTRRTVVTWLARRRLQAPDRAREVAATIAGTGLAMLVFSLASLSSLHDTVEDRAAVAVGAQTVYRLGTSWRVDPGVAQQATPPKDFSPLPLSQVPVARNPVLPPGQSVTWRASTTLAASDVGTNILAVDPARLGDSASWGSPGSPVGRGRARVEALAAEDASAAAAIRAKGFPVPVPSLLVGSAGSLDLRVGDTVTVDTLNVPIRLAVRGILPTFPGVGTGQTTFVVPADSFFATQQNEDPRLRPGVRAPRGMPVEFQAYLWADDPAAAARTLEGAGVDPELTGTLAQERATPVYVAAEQAGRYQVALGVVFGVAGLAAVVLAGIRLARRSPAADRMLAWAGAGRRAPARARAVEVAVVLALSCVLAALALLALRPIAHLLLEPGDGRDPVAVLAVPGATLLVAAGWLGAGALAALAAMALAASSQPAVEVLRGED